MKNSIFYSCFITLLLFFHSTTVSLHIQKLPLETIVIILSFCDFKTKKAYIRSCTEYYNKPNTRECLFRSLSADDYTLCMIHYAKNEKDATSNPNSTFHYILNNEGEKNEKDRLAISRFYFEATAGFPANPTIGFGYDFTLELYRGKYQNKEFFSNKLVQAIDKSNSPAVRLYLALGADINKRETQCDSWKPLDRAMHLRERNNEIIIQLLMHKDHIDDADGYERTALYTASITGNQDIVLWLLKNNPNQKLTKVLDGGSTALHAVCRNKYPDILELLLAYDKSSINEQNNSYRKHGNETALHCATRKNCIKSVQLLLACDNIDTEIRNSKNETAHDIAIKKNFTDIDTLFRRHAYSSHFLIQ